MKNLYSIGEVSKIKGVTIKALRYYQKVGILEPSYVDENSGYRYYSIEQFIHIDIIKGCRTLGTSIEELQKIFKESDTDKLVEFLQDKKSEAEETIKKMREITEDITMLTESVKKSKIDLSNDEIEIRHFEERYVVVSECKESGSLKELLYYSDLDKVIQENNIDVNLDRGMIYNIKDNKNVEPVYVFSGIMDINNVEDREYIKILPEGDYLIISYNKQNEKKRIKKIIEYVENNKLQIKVFLEFELYDELFNIDKDSYSCQLQLLISEG